MKWLLLAALLSTGCTTTHHHFCDYDLTADGWRPSAAPPAALLLKPGERGLKWFVNEAGDVLGCYELSREGVCGSAYTVYRMRAGMLVEDETIVCTS